MNSPFITVGITCFNAEGTIIRAMLSALGQDYKNFELLVVDDGSSDQSCAVIEKFMEQNSSIRLIKHTENKGFPAALNTLLDQAKGEYIAFFDDDDDSEPNRLSAQIERITAFSTRMGTDKILCYSNRSIILPAEFVPDHVALAIGRAAPEPHGRNVADFILWHTHDRQSVWGLFGSCTLMAKTHFLRGIGGFDINFRRSAELDMAVRAAQARAYFIAVDAPLVRQHKTVTADKTGNIPLKYALQLRKKHKDYLVDRGVYAESLCITLYQHHCNKMNNGRAFLWMALACLFAPRKIFWEKLSFWVKKKRKPHTIHKNTFRRAGS